MNPTTPAVPDLPALPQPNCSYADHSYPAYNKSAMTSYGQSCIAHYIATQPAPSGDAVEVLREALDKLIDVAEACDSWQSFPRAAINEANAALATTSRAATVAKDGGKPVATVIKKGADRQWMSEDLGSLPDGVYSLYLAPKPEASAANQQAVPMRDDKITVIPQNMREYQISVRDADFENDLFSNAFDGACKEGQVSQASEEAMLGADWFKDGWSAAVRCLAAPISEGTPAAPAACNGDALAEMEARKDAAYLERNQVVAALAKCFPSGVARTAIEGWSEDWHGCVYIDLPTGQASWHFHDSQAHLFAGLPAYVGEWDGHTTEEKYGRLAGFAARAGTGSAGSEAISDEQIIGVLHAAGIDTKLSLYGFEALQVAGTNVPGIKGIVAKCIACLQSGEWPAPLYDFDSGGNVVRRATKVEAAPGNAGEGVA